MDGTTLDNVIDYFNYVAVPAMMIYWFGFVPEGWEVPAAAAIMTPMVPMPLAPPVTTATLFANRIRPPFAFLSPQSSMQRIWRGKLWTSEH